MTLSQFEKAGSCMEVLVPGLSETLWFVSRDEDAERLRLDGIRRGRIWTAAELRDLMVDPGMTHEDALSLARAKMAVNATVADVRPADPPTPDALPAPAHTEPVQRPLGLGTHPDQEQDR